jgi:hypothetical protein
LAWNRHFNKPLADLYTLPLTLLVWNRHFNKPLADVYITTHSLGLEHALVPSQESEW